MLAYLQYLLVKGFSLFINLLPDGFSLWIGRQLGRMAYQVDRGHRKVALQNLRIAFGNEKSEKERTLIAKRTFENLGMTMIEFFQIPEMDTEALNRRVNVEGLEILKGVLNNKKGVLMLLSHFGNWEMMGLVSRFLESQPIVIAKPIKKNRWLDRMIMEIRTSAGLEVVSTEKAGRKVMEALAQNRPVGILIDQRAKRSEGVWADFFGRKAPTTRALAVLAMRTGAPILPIFMVRNGYRKHRLVMREPLQLVRTGNVKKDVEVNTELMNHALEGMIRQYPDQWFWVHRRWERAKKRGHRQVSTSL